MLKVKKKFKQIRVSINRQGESDLLIDAQSAAVDAYVNGGGQKSLIAKYVETESGRKQDRSELEKSIKRAPMIGQFASHQRASPDLRDRSTPFAILTRLYANRNINEARC